MNNMIIKEEEVDVSEYQEVVIGKKKQIGSTKYSNNSRSKIKQEQESEQSQTFRVGMSKRKQQNKESAKRCRIKKKQRQQLLNEKQKQLVEQLAKLKAENEKVKGELEKYVSGFTVPNVFNKQAKREGYKKLSKTIETDDIIDEDQINLILDNIKNKYGATGTERQSKITYLFKQIIHICFPALHRYLMWTAKNKSHYFGDCQKYGSWLDESHQILDLSIQQQQFFKSKKETFQQKYQIFSTLISEMKYKKNILENESQKLEDMIEEVRYILTPIQCVKFITFIENNKYKAQMALWVKRNIRKFSNDMISPATDPGCKKKPKNEK